MLAQCKLVYGKAQITTRCRECFGTSGTVALLLPLHRWRPIRCSGVRLSSRANLEHLEHEIRRQKSVEDHLEFFSKHGETLQAATLCFLLEHLCTTLQRLHIPETMPEAQHHLFKSSQFIGIMREVARKLPSFGPNHLPRLLSTLHTEVEGPRTFQDGRTSRHS